MFDSFVRETFILTLLVSALPLVVSSFVGLVVGVIQTATQIQEQNLVYVLRFLSVSAVLYFCADWIMQKLISFLQMSLSSLEFFGKL